MSNASNADTDSLQKLVDTIAKLKLNIQGSIRTAYGDYELETYYDEVVIEDSEGSEVVRAEIETNDA